MRPKYLCFSKDHDPDNARLTFENRYHVAPQEHKLEHGILWVGPIPGQEARLFEIIEIPDQNEAPMQLLML